MASGPAGIGSRSQLRRRRKISSVCARANGSTTCTSATRTERSAHDARKGGHSLISLSLCATIHATPDTRSVPLQPIHRAGKIHEEGSVTHEVSRGTNLTDTDSDGDGLLDGSEVHQHGTDPTATDTDGDGVSDRAEIQAGTDRDTATRTATGSRTNANWHSERIRPSPILTAMGCPTSERRLARPIRPTQTRTTTASSTVGSWRSVRPGTGRHRR